MGYAKRAREARMEGNGEVESQVAEAVKQATEHPKLPPASIFIHLDPETGDCIGVGFPADAPRALLIGALTQAILKIQTRAEKKEPSRIVTPFRA